VVLGNEMTDGIGGQLEAIMVRAVSGGETVRVGRTRVDVGRGLQGDRYWQGKGTFSGVRKPGRELTLIASEALEGLRRDTGIDLEPDHTGRNLLTSGIELNELVGRRFRVGGIECVGRDLCEPCQTLAGRTEQGVLRGLVGRGGLRADILVGGEIAVGDRIVAVEGADKAGTGP
jgi:MOSC domain-containing protein YiiM